MYVRASVEAEPSRAVLACIVDPNRIGTDNRLDRYARIRNDKVGGTGDIRIAKGQLQKSESTGVARQTIQATTTIDGIIATRIPSKKSWVISMLHSPQMGIRNL